MSTPCTCGHFQMPPLFIRQLWRGTDKGVAEEEWERRWRIFSHAVTGNPNRIKSARPSMFHITLQKESGYEARVFEGQGGCSATVLIHLWKVNEWQQLVQYICCRKLFFTRTVCHSRMTRTVRKMSSSRQEMLQDEKQGDEEPPSLLRYLHESHVGLGKPHTHTAINHLAAVLLYAILTSTPLGTTGTATTCRDFLRSNIKSMSVIECWCLWRKKQQLCITDILILYIQLSCLIKTYLTDIELN